MGWNRSIGGEAAKRTAFREPRRGGRTASADSDDGAQHGDGRGQARSAVGPNAVYVSKQRCPQGRQHTPLLLEQSDQAGRVNDRYDVVARHHNDLSTFL